MLGLSGERLREDEVEQLLTGMEDSQGNVNYEGNAISLSRHFLYHLYNRLIELLALRQ